MLKLSIIEFFLRGIPECFLFMFAGYAFSRMTLDKSRFIKSSMIFAIITYLIRLLPISFGVHTILIMIVFIVLATSINKINLVNSIVAAIIIFIIQFISEFINFLIIQDILGLSINEAMRNPIKKLILGMPSLAITAFIVGIYYFRLLRKNKLVHSTNTSDI